MKMAKASEADLRMAMDLCNAFDVLGQRFVPCMPEAIEILGADDEREPFDSDDDAQCGRALRHLLEIAERGSLMRVIWGMAVLLDPANKIVDPAADTLEHHPDVSAALAAAKAAEPAAQAGRPPAPSMTEAQIQQWWASENGLEDCDLCKIVDFRKVVHAVLAKAAEPAAGGTHA